MTDPADMFDADLSDELALETVKSISIPACPEVVVELLDEVRRGDVDFIKVSRLVTGDVALAAAVLKTANSPFFALRRKIRTVQQAVSVLGLRNLLKIIYGVVLKKSLTGAEGSPEMTRFWDRSHYNAVVCSYLAARLPGVSVDDAYTFGLFHDAGLAVLMQKFPDYKQTLLLATALPRQVTAIEDERHHTNHVIVGTLLGRNWYLPEHVVWAVRYHHDYSILTLGRAHANRETCRLVAIRLIAEHIVAHFQNYPDDAEWEEAKDAALSYLGWFEDDLDDMAGNMRGDLHEIRAYRG